MNIKKRMRMNNKKYSLTATRSMLYECEKCGKRWDMYLQEGLEEPGENHKPVPFGITCKCGGSAFHVLWNLDKRYNPPVFITEKMSYFKNDPKKDCGQPIVR